MTISNVISTAAGRDSLPLSEEEEEEEEVAGRGDREMARSGDRNNELLQLDPLADDQVKKGE